MNTELLVGTLIFLPVAVAVAYTDWKTRRIPNKILLCGLAASPVGWIFAPPTPDPMWLVSAILLLCFFGAHFSGKVGAGDVKYIMTGMAAYAAVPLTMPLALIFTAFAAVPFKRKKIPFAAFNLIGLVLAIFTLSSL